MKIPEKSVKWPLLCINSMKKDLGGDPPLYIAPSPGFFSKGVVMARKRREVEPSLVVNQEWKRIWRKTFLQSLSEEPLWAKGLWSVMITMADENGEGNLRQVTRISRAGHRHPTDTSTTAKVRQWAGQERISLFEKDDVTFYKFCNWDKYQGISFPTGEERRVEEIREENTDDAQSDLLRTKIAPEPADSPSPPEVQISPIPKKSEPLLEFDIPADLFGLQLYREDRKLCKAWPEFLAAARTAYPGVDVMEEVRKAHAWEVANPSNRKKLRTRFLGNWLARSQDRARAASNGPRDTSGPGNGSGGLNGPASGQPERKCFRQIEDEYREQKLANLFKEKRL